LAVVYIADRLSVANSRRRQGRAVVVEDIGKRGAPSNTKGLFAIDLHGKVKIVEILAVTLESATRALPIFACVDSFEANASSATACPTSAIATIPAATKPAVEHEEVTTAPF